MTAFCFWARMVRRTIAVTLRATWALVTQASPRATFGATHVGGAVSWPAAGPAATATAASAAAASHRTRRAARGERRGASDLGIIAAGRGGHPPQALIAMQGAVFAQSRRSRSPASASNSPVWYASTTACTRSRRSSFWRMWVTCVLTVVSLM